MLAQTARTGGVPQGPASGFRIPDRAVLLATALLLLGQWAGACVPAEVNPIAPLCVEFHRELSDCAGEEWTEARELLAESRCEGAGESPAFYSCVTACARDGECDESACFWACSCESEDGCDKLEDDDDSSK